MKTSKMLVLSGLCGCLLLAVAFQGEAQPQEKDLNAELSELKSEVAALRAEVKKLQERVEDLEAAKGGIVINPSMIPGLRQLPEGWTEKYINGVKYYVIPTQEGQQQTLPAVRPLPMKDTR